MSNNQVECSCSVCSPNGRYSVMVSSQTRCTNFADDVQRNFQRQSLLPTEAVDMMNDNANDIEIDAKTNISEDLEYNYIFLASFIDSYNSNYLTLSTIAVHDLPGSNNEDLSNSYEFNNKSENIED
ncbi:hypothetical protein PHYBLDRAFT_72798 [Phycomyces blakesleeanus NRRL 1555(-)]|uniref:Uncharacterized protein n=1 Tax=Phycomyces blakesleeanus (strain ATCC 8743b / DSM 1359 / FGSC 10004 / NBRC 33097 / NRRL 1555) TaxID=763407 RepID=A0A167RBC5_PHYB8|nr:hypothetical protein PHYBLDRAFT_72798 [Phycomyces blakesleeanus NRRL 1555(-)]OAD81278.1 hypothetical protein PHYBLDRAFT_72798 [Phycomyces blakesleeanus NRRL 1555(-)]|eukprot:XP_018299318.1 hypothetical protein PHYBLDRAFT_72798 [Phycomyces blakesleeanus NRRL 1555(-)]